MMSSYKGERRKFEQSGKSQFEFEGGNKLDKYGNYF